MGHLAYAGEVVPTVQAKTKSVRATKAGKQEPKLGYELELFGPYDIALAFTVLKLRGNELSSRVETPNMRA